MRHFILTATFAGLIGGAGLWAPAALAQDMGGPDGKPKAKEDEKAAQKAAKKAQKQADKTERTRRRGLDVDRYTKQMAEALELSEEQSAQLRAILAESAERQEALRTEAEAKTTELEVKRTAQIRGLLTEAQAAKFDQMQTEREERRRQRTERPRGRRGGAEGGGERGMRQGGGRMGGGPGGLLGFDPRQVMGELALDEGQQEQARDIMRSVMSGLREKVGQARQQGPEAMQAVMADIRASVKAQLSAILTEEQRVKFEELVAQGGGAGTERGRRGEERGQRGRRERRPSSPEERMERRLGNVLEAMALTEDEVMILKPQIERILKLDADTGATAEAERKALEELLKAEGEVDGDGIRARMEALRKVREEQQAKRAELEKELRELVTIKQEGMLFLHRVLR